MRVIELNKNYLELITLDISIFNERTNFEYDMDLEEVLFSILNSTDEITFCLNDWDEGKSNDPYWDEEKDQHCCYSFLQYMIKKYFR